MNLKTYSIISILVLSANFLSGQSNNILDNIEYDNNLRFGYSFSNGIIEQSYKTTRFLGTDHLFNLNKWTSSKSIYQLNDLPVNFTTLNFNSIDLLPVEYHNNYRVSDDNSDFSSVANQTVFIDTKPIQEKFTLLFNGYLGSQTGDPLTNIFVDTNYTLQNVNKIPLSGTISISNSNKKVGYRITGGYYGSFTTGGENDLIIASINHYYFGKLNKQILFSGETFYNFDGGEVLDLKIQFMSYYGWDISPFTTSFIHFENYFHRVQLSLKNLFENLNLSLKKDASLGKINEGEGILPSTFEQSEYSLYGRWSSPLNSSSTLLINGDINYYKWNNLNNDDESNPSRDYFSKENDIVNYLLSGTYSSNITSSVIGRLNIQFQAQNNYKMLSAGVDLKKLLRKNLFIKLALSSHSNAPNVSELYGNYGREAFVSGSHDRRLFSIKGNSQLAYMRSNKISIEFAYHKLNELLQLSLQPFAETIQNAIEQNTLNTVRISSTGEILRNAQYKNVDRDLIFGTYFFLKTRIAEKLFFTMETQALLKGESEYLPTLKNYMQLSFISPKTGTISASWYYRSKTIWEEYSVQSVNDHYSNSGFDGVLPEASIVNLFYKFTLKPFYVFKSLQLKIIFENIFNSTQKYIPIGNSINRAFIFEVVGEI